MRSTPWRTLDRELGASRTVLHNDHEGFRIVVTVARPWVMDSATTWSGHVHETTTGLTLWADDFIDRRSAEAWCWYRTVATWNLLAEYRDLLTAQHKAHAVLDGQEADQRHLVLARIEKMAERDEERDQFSAEFWLPFEADVDPEVDPELRFVPAPPEAVAELDENPALLPDDGPA